MWYRMWHGTGIFIFKTNTNSGVWKFNIIVIYRHFTIYRKILIDNLYMYLLIPFYNIYFWDVVYYLAYINYHSKVLERWWKTLYLI